MLPPLSEVWLVGGLITSCAGAAEAPGSAHSQQRESRGEGKAAPPPKAAGGVISRSPVSQRSFLPSWPPLLTGESVSEPAASWAKNVC